MTTLHRRRIVIDSDDDDDNSSHRNEKPLANVLKTPATKSITNATISANAHTVDKSGDAIIPPPQRDVRLTTSVPSRQQQDRGSDSSDEWSDYGEHIINIMQGGGDDDTHSPSKYHGRGGRSSSHRSRSSSSVVIDKSEEEEDEEEEDDAVMLPSSQALPRAPTPQFTTTAAHTAHNSSSRHSSSSSSSSSSSISTSDTPPSCQVPPSRRSSRLSKGPTQDKIDLQLKLRDLRELRNRSKKSIGALNDSSSGSEDLEIQAMAAKHQRDVRKRTKQRSRLEQKEEGRSGSESDHRVTRRFGHNQVESEEEGDPYELDDMSNFIVDDDEVEEEEEEVYVLTKSKGRSKGKNSRSRSRSKSSPPRGKKTKKRSKRRIRSDSDSDSSGDGGCESGSGSGSGSNAGHGSRRCHEGSRSIGRSAHSKPLKRHRLEPVLQAVPERKRKRRIEDSDSSNEEEEEEEDGEDEVMVSEDSAAIDHRRQRKKGKVQQYQYTCGATGGMPSTVISPLAATATAATRRSRNGSRGRRGTRAPCPSSKAKTHSNRKVVHDDEEDSSSSSHSSMSAASSEEESDGDEEEEDEEEVADGFSLYRQLDLQQQEREDEDIDAGGAPPVMFRKSLSASEALGVYIELLLCILTDTDYRQKYAQCTDGSLHVGMALSRADQTRVQEHRRAARTVENLICTSRESLLGSSVWRGEFFRELTTRPFYNVTFRDCCSSSGHMPDDRGKERGLERCDACGRENKSSGGYKLHLFGPAYDASGLWSSQRWMSKMPPTILNSVLSYVTAPTPSSSSSSSSSNVMSGTSQAHTSSSTRERTTPFSCSRRTHSHTGSSGGGSGSAYSPRLTPGHRQQQAAAETFKTDLKRMLYLQANLPPDQDTEEQQQQQRQREALSSPTAALSSALLKRVSISGNPPSSHSPRSHGSSRTASASAPGSSDVLGGDKRRRRHSRPFSDDSEGADDGSDDSDSENESECESDVVGNMGGGDDGGEEEEEEASTPWWQRKWGKDLAAEPETEWVVNSHCKRRTQMYHSLLHYKFRLLLKIRERVRQKALRSGPLSPIASPHGSGVRRRGRGGEGGKEGDESSSDDSGSGSGSGSGSDGSETGRRVSVSAVLGGGFVAAEVRRFEDLLAVAGQQFGGEEHSKFSIWSDDEDSPVKARKSASSSSSSSSSSALRASSVFGSGSSGGRGRGHHRRGPTLDAWLTSTPSSASASSSSSSRR